MSNNANEIFWHWPIPANQMTCTAIFRWYNVCFYMHVFTTYHKIRKHINNDCRYMYYSPTFTSVQYTITHNQTVLRERWFKDRVPLFIPITSETSTTCSALQGKTYNFFVSHWLHFPTIPGNCEETAFGISTLETCHNPKGKWIYMFAICFFLSYLMVCQIHLHICEH